MRHDDGVRLTGAEGSTPLRLLIDSNFYITLEPYAGKLETGQPTAAEVVRLAAQQGHTLFVHPATRDDLLQASDPVLRAQRLAELDKFPPLAEGPIPAALTAGLGTSKQGSNDHRDLRLLAALHNNAVTYLISNDVGLRKRAVRVGLGERVLTRDDAAEMLRQLTPTLLTPPPRVRWVEPYALDGDQDIFASLRDDYDQFDEWLRTKVRPDTQNRECLVIEEDATYAALAIVKKVEPDCVYGFPQPVTKLATLKVSDDFRGRKYGELLLKSVFLAAHERGNASVFVEVLPKHQPLIELLGLFGFEDSNICTPRGELVLVKHLRPMVDAEDLPALDHHIRYGPPAVRGTGKVFMVPIWPAWHEQLFPDAPSAPPPPAQQLELLGEPELRTHPWGNALRKAYLCHSKVKQIGRGDTLLFYRSRDAQSVSAIGVVEETLRSPDPAEVMSFVSGRTVYRPDEITTMCARVDGVLAILFRQDRFVDPPWDLAELQANQVVTAWPQSITQVRGRGAQWVHERLSE